MSWMFVAGSIRLIIILSLAIELVELMDWI